MKSCEAISRGRSLRARRLLNRKNVLKERKSSRIQEKRKSLKGQKNKLKHVAVVDDDLEVVFDRNWFAEEEVGKSGKLNKKPFVLVLNIGADDTLAKQEVTNETLARKALKLRALFISVKKISINDKLNKFDVKDNEVDVEQDVEAPTYSKLRTSFVYLQKMHVNDKINDKNEVETEDEEDSDGIDYDDVESENFEKLLEIRDKLRVKVKNHEKKKNVQFAPEVYDSLKEYRTICLLIEKNSETDMD